MHVINNHLLLNKFGKLPLLTLEDREILSNGLAWEDIQRIFTRLVRFLNLVFFQELIGKMFSYIDLAKMLEKDPALLAPANVLAVHRYLLQHFPSSIFADSGERKMYFSLFNKVETYSRPVFANLAAADRESVFANYAEAFDEYIGFLVGNMGLRIASPREEPQIWLELGENPSHPLLILPSRDTCLDLFPFLIFEEERYYLWEGGESPYSFFDESGRVVLLSGGEIKQRLVAFFELFLLAGNALSLLDETDDRYLVKALVSLEKIKTYWDAEEYEDLVKEVSEYKFCIYKISNNRVEERNFLLDYLNGVGLARTGKENEAVVEFKRLIRQAPDMIYPYRELEKIYEKSGHSGDAERLRETMPRPDLPPQEEGTAGILPHMLARKPKPQRERAAVPRELVDLKEMIERLSPLVIGRERECMEIIEILCCMNRNNCLLVGDPGVGKTSIIHQVVTKLSKKDVPDQLQDIAIYELNIAAALADSRQSGQFPGRLEGILAGLENENCILVIDDIHFLINGQSQRSSPLNLPYLLKPLLERKNTHVIATTTYEEHLKSIGSIPLFARMFQKIDLKELPLSEVATILKIKAEDFGRFHRVSLDIDSICQQLEVVKLFFRDRMLPDKAIELLDRTCARIALGQRTDREERSAVEVSDFLRTIADDRGVELSSISTTLRDKLIRLEDALKARIIGQDEVIGKLSKKIIPARTGLKVNRFRPDAVFLFLGPTGVGKTETARILARNLYGSDDKFLRIDMSEYMEEYSVSKLIGSAPGYVGYEDQNQFIDEIRKDPYRLVLLDEIEKAHPTLINIFLQVFDSGVLTDARGRKAYFDKCVIIMTSNVGASLFSQEEIGFLQGNRHEVTKTAHSKELKRFFKPEFLNRIDEVVMFNSLSLEDARKIARLNIDLINRRFTGNLHIHASPSVIDFLARKGFSREYGARELLRVIQDQILQKIADLRLRSDRPVHEVYVSHRKGQDRLTFKRSR